MIRVYNFEVLIGINCSQTGCERDVIIVIISLSLPRERITEAAKGLPLDVMALKG